jgi:hypothetical protein
VISWLLALDRIHFAGVPQILRNQFDRLFQIAHALFQLAD